MAPLKVTVGHNGSPSYISIASQFESYSVYFGFTVIHFRTTLETFSGQRFTTVSTRVDSSCQHNVDAWKIIRLRSIKVPKMYTPRTVHRFDASLAQLAEIIVSTSRSTDCNVQRVPATPLPTSYMRVYEFAGVANAASTSSSSSSDLLMSVSYRFRNMIRVRESATCAVRFTVPGAWYLLVSQRRPHTRQMEQ